MQKSFYITTTLPYVNNDPHVGFAMEIIRADVIARYKTALGYDVFFNTGTDEHGQKLFEAAQVAGKDTKEYVDSYAAKFKELTMLLGISENIHFIRTTDTHHESAAQALWKLVEKDGYIYKKNYQSKYCVGCEENKTDSELNEDGRCPIHPNRELEIREEENYFFKFSSFGEKLLAYYEAHPDFIIPDFRMNEMREFIKRGLEDFSISRLKEKMSWGIPVPGDEAHVMYVWFDALTNYISTLGWPEDTAAFKKYWEEGTPVQYCGKDNTRFQGVMWQAMLLAAGLPQTRHVVVNGFITSAGQKMSKSLGNVISPFDLLRMFTEVAGDLSSDVLRYYLLRHINSFEDSDMTIETVKEAYTANLANGLGNLTSRILTLSEKYLAPQIFEPLLINNYKERIEQFDLQRAMDIIFGEINELDKFIQETAPFTVIKTDEVKGKELITTCVEQLNMIAAMLIPFLPKTAEKILMLIKENKKPTTPLFARLP